MTETTMTSRPIHGLAVWLLHGLPQWRRSHRRTAALDALSDRMLADVGMERDAIDRMGVNTLHAAMRSSL